MANVFTYSITQDIPGGAFPASASDRLVILIQTSITTPLQEVTSTGDVLTVIFATDITVAEKTILDGDTTNPSGGLIGQCADYIQLTSGGIAIQDQDELGLPADGIQSKTIVLQAKKGDATDIISSETYLINTMGLAPINKGGDALISGTSNFIVGPSYSRGLIQIEVKVNTFQTRTFLVRFDS